MVINKFIFMQLLFFDYQWSLLFLLGVGIRVVQFQSFTKAAQSLGYSQSAVTIQIKNLEHELGTHLLDRIGRQVSLTPARTDTRFSSKEKTQSAIQSPICCICSSFIPRLVTAGVPTRRPDVIVGPSGSPGIEFLFAVI